MSGRGRGGKGLGKGGAKRHPVDSCGCIPDITRPSIRRLARLGGVKCISGLIYEDFSGALLEFLEKLISDTLEYFGRSGRETVIAMDVLYALKRQGRTLHCFSG
uniref:Histone H4 n=1 Tax=Panagrolaimus sp. JU765 TaxID=591449 RepID=A0AC34Q7A6_9BILA